LAFAQEKRQDKDGPGNINGVVKRNIADGMKQEMYLSNKGQACRSCSAPAVIFVFFSSHLFSSTKLGKSG